VFYPVLAMGLHIRRKIEARKLSLKGSAVQRGLQPGSRGIAIVRSRYHTTTSEDCGMENTCTAWK
jgi:hypothetical protein